MSASTEELLQQIIELENHIRDSANSKEDFSLLHENLLLLKEQFRLLSENLNDSNKVLKG